MDEFNYFHLDLRYFHHRYECFSYLLCMDLLNYFHLDFHCSEDLEPLLNS